MNTRPESQGDYEQEAKQIPPGHKLLNGKLVRSLDSNSPIKKNRRKLERNICWPASAVKVYASFELNVN